jgi:hypothetical protein
MALVSIKSRISTSPVVNNPNLALIIWLFHFMSIAARACERWRFPNWKSLQLVLINYNQRKRRGRNRIPHRNRRRRVLCIRSTQLWMGTLLCARLELYVWVVCMPPFLGVGRSSIILTPAATCAQKAHAVSRNLCAPRVIWNVTFHISTPWYILRPDRQWVKQAEGMIYVSANQIKVNPIAGKVYFRCNQKLKMQQQLYIYTRAKINSRP